MKRTVICLVLALCFYASSTEMARSQSYSARYLRGLRDFSVLVESINSNDCGVDAGSVETSLRFILAQASITLDSGSSNTLYLNVNVLPNCSAASIDLQVQTLGKVSSAQFPILVSVWQEGALLGGVGNMNQRVQDAVEEQTKKFVADWASVNR